LSFCARDDVIEVADSAIRLFILDAIHVFFGEVEVKCYLIWISCWQIVSNEHELSFPSTISVTFRLSEAINVRWIRLGHLLAGPCVECAVVIGWEPRFLRRCSFPGCRGSSIGIVDVDRAILTPDSHSPVLWEVSLFEVEFDVEARLLAGVHRHRTVLSMAAFRTLMRSSFYGSDRVRYLLVCILATCGKAAVVPSVESEEHILCYLR